MALDSAAKRATTHTKLSALASVTITRQGGGTVDTFGLIENYRADQIDGTLIQKGDVRLMCSALNTAEAAFDDPEAEDRAAVAGQDWVIKAVDPFAPAGTPIFHYLQLRAG